MTDGMKDIIKYATSLVLSRSSDVDTEDGSFATVEIDELLHLEAAIAKEFELEGDEVCESDTPKILALIASK